jgi:hypothetical protein
MPGVLYHTKSNNKEIKKLLNNPRTGRELIKKLLIDRNKKSLANQITIESNGTARTLTVTELGVKSSNK